MDIMVEEWLEHPITKQLFDVIEKEKKDLVDMLITGQAERKTCEDTGLAYTKLVNIIGGLDIIQKYKAQLQEGNRHG